MKCELDVEYNPCEFLEHEKGECNNPGTCSFQEKKLNRTDNEPKKEKWFEKYYRK